MKKLFTTILIVCLAGIIVMGQQLDNRRFAFVAKAPMFNWITSNDSGINSSGVNLGYSLGASVEFAINDNIFMTGGLSFSGGNGGEVRHETGGNFWPRARLSNREWNEGVKPLPNDVELRYRINMLEIPVGLKFYTNYNGNTRYFFELPIISVGFLTSSRGDITAPGIEAKDEVIPEQTRGIQFNIGGSAGISYDLGFAEVFGGLHYQRALTDLTRNNGRKAIDIGGGEFTTADEISRHIMQGIGLKVGVLF